MYICIYIYILYIMQRFHSSATFSHFIPAVPSEAMCRHKRSPALDIQCPAPLVVHAL